jgi:hypothetical protein
MKFAIGKEVYFLNYNVWSWQDTPEFKTGYVFYDDGYTIGFAKHRENSKYSDVTYVDLRDESKEGIIGLITLESLNDAIKTLEGVIEKEQGKIKRLTAEEKEDIKAKEFDRLKEQCRNTIVNMIDCDDDDFIQKLKALCRLKEQMFSIKISDLENIHQRNGEVKYRIKKLNKLLAELYSFKCQRWLDSKFKEE